MPHGTDQSIGCRKNKLRNGQKDFHGASHQSLAAERVNGCARLLRWGAIHRVEGPPDHTSVPFWKDVLTGEGYDAHFVLMYRNPLEVAASLKVRNGMPLFRGFQLWQHYAVSALLPDTEIELAAVVSFEDLLTRPEETLVSSVLAKFGDNFASNKRALLELRSHVAQTDRHHLFTVKDVMDSPDVPNLVKKSWQLLQAWQEMAPQERIQEVRAVCDIYEDAARLFGTHMPNPPKKRPWHFWG